MDQKSIYNRQNMTFYSFGLKHDPMTLMLKLDMIKMCPCTKDKVPRFSETDRQTDPAEISTYPHT